MRELSNTIIPNTIVMSLSCCLFDQNGKTTLTHHVYRMVIQHFPHIWGDSDCSGQVCKERAAVGTTNEDRHNIGIQNILFKWLTQDVWLVIGMSYQRCLTISCFASMYFAYLFSLLFARIKSPFFNTAVPFQRPV